MCDYKLLCMLVVWCSGEGTFVLQYITKQARTTYYLL